jgi:hypothetical protein
MKRNISHVMAQSQRKWWDLGSFMAGIKKLADTLKTTAQTKTVDNLNSKTERKRFKNRNFA